MSETKTADHRLSDVDLTALIDAFREASLQYVPFRNETLNCLRELQEARSEIKERKFFDSIPKLSLERSREMIAEARRQGALPPAPESSNQISQLFNRCLGRVERNEVRLTFENAKDARAALAAIESLGDETTPAQGAEVCPTCHGHYFPDKGGAPCGTPTLHCDAAEEYVIKAFLALGHRADHAQIAEVAAKVRAASPVKTTPTQSTGE